MLNIAFTASFLKKLKKFDIDFQEDAIEKMRIFQDIKNHESLRVHKLKGKFSGCYSFSINYKMRIVFKYLSKKEAILIAIGDHDLYR